MRYRFIALVLCLLSGSKVAISAGFDCSLANLSPTEKTICSNEYLSGLDSALNNFFKQAYDSSLSHGRLAERQKEWLKERNSCQGDVTCITNSYLIRNRSLTASNKLQNVNDIFNREGDKLDEMLDGPIKTRSGFTITDSPWLVKKIFSSDSFESGINLEGMHVSSVLTYQEIKDDLYIYISVSGRYQGKKITLLVELVDDQNPRIIQQYDGYLNIISRTRDAQGNALAYFAVGNDLHKEYHYLFISPDGGKSISDISSEQADALTKKTTPWTGYCGSSECNASLISPDSKWRLASSDGNVKDPDEGMYVFPVNRPDQGLNVFADKADNSITDDAFGYTRQYVWGDDSNTFYFDNSGALGCIWKTDIDKKTTKRIIPVEGILDPFYIKYDGEDLILSVYSYSYQDDFKSEIYIAKEPN
ncbi:TPA: lysozyme inhibitor LprI family protein [Klebsiella pneumoniae]